MTTYYIDTDVSGGDADGSSWANAFSSLSAWEATQATPTDDIEIICRASSGTADTSAITINHPTSASYDVTIKAADSDRATAEGWDTDKYRLTGGLSISQAKSDNFDGLQISETSAWSYALAFSFANSGSTPKISNCYFQTGANIGGITINDSDIEMTVENCIFDCGRYGLYVGGSSTVNIYNSVITGAATSGVYVLSGSTATITNCAIFDNTDDINNAGTATISYCASDDGDGTNSVSPSGSDWDNEFTDYASGDFTLLDSGNLFEAGTPISGLTEDIDGDTYDTTSPSIGVDEPTSGATAYSITAESGTFIHTGTAADLLKGYAIDAGSGSFTETGTAAGLYHGFAIDADSGTFILTGQDAALQYGANTSITAEAGAYTLTGSGAGLLKGYTLDAEAGTLVFTGSDATLTYAEANSIDAEAGTFTATGTAADLLKTWKLTAEAGSFIETGTDAALNYGLALNAETGAFTETGTAAALLKGWLISAEAGAIAYTGNDVTLTYAAEFIPIDRRDLSASVTLRRTVTAAMLQSKTVTSQVTQRYDMEATIGG